MKKWTRFFIVLCLAFTLVLALAACAFGDEKDDGTVNKPAPPACHVTFDYNDGTGRTAKVTVPAGEKISDYAPNVIGDCTEVVGWSLEVGGPDYEIAVSGDVVLYAKWQTYELVEYTAETLSGIVNNRFVRVQFTEADAALGGKVLRIGSDARSVQIVSDGTPHTDFSIIIHERAEDVDLSFENFSYTSKGSCAMLAEGAGYKVCWHVKGENKIDAGAAQKEGANRGGDCVQGPDFDFLGDGTLTLIGGNGKNGVSRGQAAEGQHGDNGTDGEPGGIGMVANRVSVNGVTLNVYGGRGGHGGNGGQGNNGLLSGKDRNGGDGGKGAAGGAAMDIQAFSAKNATLELHGGAGGNGGAGGEDGTSSALGLFAGYGGDGGNGGAGGNVILNPITDAAITGTLKNFVVGNGGKGGAAGASHNSGKSGVSGTTAKNGVINLPEN